MTDADFIIDMQVAAHRSRIEYIEFRAARMDDCQRDARFHARVKGVARTLNTTTALNPKDAQDVAFEAVVALDYIDQELAKEVKDVHPRLRQT